MTTHNNSSDPGRDIPVSKGISPMAKVLIALALVVIFIQGGITVMSSSFGRHPPTEAQKLPLPPDK
jgi:hypothetical protein